MSKELIQLPTHCDYDDYYWEVQKVLDCVQGAAKVKRENYRYLPHPSMVDDSSDRQKARYVQYKAGAEFDDQPADTLKTMLGKMRFQKTDIEIDDKIDYLVDDADGDGTSLTASIEYAASNVIQAKFQVVVADYMGLSDVDLESVSLADAQEMDPRATLKHYTRQNVPNWHFSRVNGRMQLAWICLLERGSDFDYKEFCHDEVQSYLILGLDEDGNYYQQKMVRGAGDSLDGERVQVTVNGQPLKFIPLEIITDQEPAPGEMPKGEGYLAKICNASLHKYEMSAVYKETMRNMQPTVITKGWKSNDLELFKEINGGRDYVATGSVEVNNLPRDVDYDVLSIDTAMTPFEWYFTYADKKILSMGGTAKQEMSNMTATEADINASEQNAMLETLADNLESSFERLCNYCLMFEGAITPDEAMTITDRVDIELPRDFATPKLSVDEVKVLIELHNAGQMTDEELDAQLKKGGWRSKDFAIESLGESQPLLGVNRNRPTPTPNQNTD